MLIWTLLLGSLRNLECIRSLLTKLGSFAMRRLFNATLAAGLQGAKYPRSAKATISVKLHRIHSRFRRDLHNSVQINMFYQLFDCFSLELATPRNRQNSIICFVFERINSSFRTKHRKRDVHSCMCQFFDICPLDLAIPLNAIFLCKTPPQTGMLSRRVRMQNEAPASPCPPCTRTSSFP